jgi:NAD-dependent deacetylase
MFAEDLISKVRNARSIVVFTGAGVSAESGIPTFRDAQTGLWEHYDATLLASPNGFRSDKALVWGWYEWRRMKVLQAQPNPAHRAIAELSDQVDHFALITQNVDDLHERSGINDAIHLHGSLHQPRCFACARVYIFPETILDEPIEGRCLEPPRCQHCNGYIRPGVVWFGESLPEAAWERAQNAVRNCDVLFSVGTSAVVWPAAQLPIEAARSGATVIQINPEKTDLDQVAHYNLYGQAGTVLPLLIEAITQ